MTFPNTMRPSSRSHFSKTVCLGKWWLFKSKQEVDGKSLAVAVSTSSEQGSVRVFVSAPFIKRHDMWNLETADGVQVVLQGFIDKFHTAENGFSDEVFDYFVFGFPTNWEECAERCFVRDEELQNCSLNTERNNVPNEVPKKKAAFGKSSENTRKIRIRANLEECVERSSERDEDRSSTGTVGNGIANNTRKRKAILQKSSANAEESNRFNVEEHAERCAKIDKEIPNCRSNTITDDGMNDPPNEKSVLQLPSLNVRTSESSIVMEEYHQRVSGRDEELSKCSPGTVTNDVTNNTSKRKTLLRKSSANDGRSKIPNAEEPAERCFGGGEEHSSYSPGTVANDIADDKPTKKTARKRSASVKSKSRVKKKLSYDNPVTPCIKESVRPAAMVSPELQGLKKSRSGRLLLPTLEFWRNQKAVYNADRVVTEIVGTPIVIESPRGTQRGGSENSNHKWQCIELLSKARKMKELPSLVDAVLVSQKGCSTVTAGNQHASSGCVYVYVIGFSFEG